MAETPDPNNLSLEDLLAFADGELDPQRHKEVLRLLAINPDAMAQVAFHHQLRQMVRRSVEAGSPATPPDLAARIMAAASVQASPAPQTPAQPPPAPLAFRSNNGARLSRRWPNISTLAAAAAIVIVGLLVLRFMPSNNANARDLPVETTKRMAGEHHRCCLSLKNLHHDIDLPQDIHELVPAAASYLGSKPYTLLDLTAVGYKFIAAGTCKAPGAPSIHVVYQPIDRNTGHTKLSLWIEKDTGRLPSITQPEKPYASADAATADTIVFWKHDGMIYYLVSDSAPDILTAIHFLQTGEVPKPAVQTPAATPAPPETPASTPSTPAPLAPPVPANP